MITKSETFIGLIHTTSGYSQTKMSLLDLSSVETLNKQTNSTMGFKIIYGRTEDGKIFEFIKAGKFCKRDITAIKQLGIIEAVTSWAFAPKRFLIPQGEKEITQSFELGKETTEHMNRWLKAMYA